MSRAVVPAGLWLGAALISGFTVWRNLEPFDEGLLMQVATRVAAGEWPYADFGWAYGPGHPLLVAGLFEAFQPSVLAWRAVRVAADATIALLVWWIVRREAGPRWALVAWLAAATTIAQPTSANPATIALALALGAVAVAAGGGLERGGATTRGGAARRRGAPGPARAAIGGLLVAAAVFWRPDLGLAGLAAVAAVLVARRAGAAALVAAGVAVATAAALYAPFAGAAGVPRLWDSLVAEAARDGAWWGLPFPLAYDGPLRAWPPSAAAEDLKDVLGYYLPLIALVATAAVAALFAIRRRLPPVVAGLGVLALGALVYLRSRPDELHVQPLVVILCALLPIALPAVRARGPLALVAAACLALVLAAGVANRLSALVLPPELEPVTLPGVPGIRVPPAEARALPPMVALVQRLVPPGEPVYVAPRRSDLVTLTNPLIHFLVRRPNVLRRDVLLQARPQEQQRIAAALERARPRAVIRWLDPASSRPEPNRRGRPSGSTALDDHLEARYRPEARFGAYEVLVPR